MARTYSIDDQKVFQRFYINDWKSLLENGLQGFIGFSMQFNSNPHRAFLILMSYSESDTEIVKEFEEFLQNNGFTKI